MSKNRPSMQTPDSTPDAVPDDADSFVSGGRGQGADSLDAVFDSLPAHEESEPVKPFNLRLPASLHKQLKALSERTGVSMNELATRFIEAGVKRGRQRLR